MEGRGAANHPDNTRQISETTAVQEAFTLIQENQQNPNFVIIGIRSPEEFDQWHVKHAINIDYRSEDFQEELVNNPDYWQY